MSVRTERDQASKATIDRIAEILSPQPIEVRILGRKPEIEGLTADATPKLEAIIVYLAFHREDVSQRFREEFWPESTSRQAADNAVMRTRVLPGNTDAGEQRLQSARSTNSYILSDDVGLDWRRVELLVTEAKKVDGADEAAFLDAPFHWLKVTLRSTLGRPTTRGSCASRRLSMPLIEAESWLLPAAMWRRRAGPLRRVLRSSTVKRSCIG